MELLGTISLFIHIIAGASTLITGPLAIFYNFKDPKKHRLVGKAFFYAMLVVVVSSVIGFLKRPDVAFFQFLMGLSILVLAGILRGVRSIFLMKGSPVTWLDWSYTILLGINGVVMVAMSAWHFSLGTMVAIPILFGVFGLSAFTDTKTNWRIFRQPELLDKVDWMMLHTRTMLGAFIASSTAFTVNAAPFLPWYVQWFGPTVLLVPIQFYFGRKLKKMKGTKRPVVQEVKAVNA